MDDLNRQNDATPILLQGIAAAPGLAKGPALVWAKRTITLHRHGGCEPAHERERLTQAVAQAQQEIKAIEEKLTAEGHPDEAAVFGAHLLLAKDRSLHKKVDQALASGLNAEAAWSDAVESFACQLDGMADPTFRLRAADLRDIGERVLNILAGADRPAGPHIEVPSIIIARDLTPSETAEMDKRLVLGFCTAGGGPTSHTAILAKALGLPAVVSLGAGVLEIAAGDFVLVDGSSGQVTAHPDAAQQTAFDLRAAQFAQQAQLEQSNTHAPAVTLDGRRVEVVANIGNAEDAAKAVQAGAEGVGLFRTEFLFLQRKTSPDEEEQYQAYRAVLDAMGDLPVVVRTLDAGGDKEVPYLAQEPEANPFLGWRAIRLCLDTPELFKQQLRALLRAGAGHDLRIMFPMIATLQEVRGAKALLAEVQAELAAQNVPMPSALQVGIMVEIPSTAVCAHQFAREVDFFSIGTNDLTQYTLAADRTNTRVAHLSDPCHPAVLQLIRQTAEAAHAAGIWLGVCGEMAGDPEAIPLLIGLGVDELSMSPSLIPRAKTLIRTLTEARAKELARQALEQDSAAAVRACVRKVS